jgi:hypothetical protein
MLLPIIAGKPIPANAVVVLVAEVSFEQGLTSRQVSGEAVRLTLKRLGIRWKRAKRWISSPDPEYARKKAHGTDC